MNPVEAELRVSVRSLVPLAISDHLARKTSYQYGVIVGKHSSASQVIAFDTFDLKVEHGVVDLKYLSKRLQLLQVVSPHLTLVGLYTCMENGHIDSALIEQIRQEPSLPDPLVALVPHENQGFKCYSLLTNGEISYTLVPSETEQIAVSSTLKHPDYSQHRQDLSLDHESTLSSSLEQLLTLLSAVLETTFLSDESERILVHLSHTIRNYQGCTSPEDHLLITSHLSLLSSQVAAIFVANEQIDQQIVAIKKARLSYLDSFGR